MHQRDCKVLQSLRITIFKLCKNALHNHSYIFFCINAIIYLQMIFYENCVKMLHNHYASVKWKSMNNLHKNSFLDKTMLQLHHFNNILV